MTRALEAHGLDRDELVAQTRAVADDAAARTHALVDAFLTQVAARPHR